MAVLIFLGAALRISVPYALAAVGAGFSERGGVINIALEGLMLNGALAYTLGAWATSNPWIGLLCAVAAGLVTAALHAVVAVGFRADQITSGLGLNDLRAVVGEIQSPQQGRTLGFGFIFGVYTRIVPPGTAKAGFSIAAGINNAGDIVGTYMDASFVDHGFLRTP